jgi:hypothetical protein
MPKSINNHFMELNAKLVQMLPAQTGSGKNGPWKKQEIIVETDGEESPKNALINAVERLHKTNVKFKKEFAAAIR